LAGGRGRGGELLATTNLRKNRLTTPPTNSAAKELGGGKLGSMHQKYARVRGEVRLVGKPGKVADERKESGGLMKNNLLFREKKKRG